MKRNNKKKEEPAAPPSSVTAMTLVPSEQFVIFSGHESGIIHRLRKNAPADEPPHSTISE